MELNVKALSPKIGTEIPAPFYASAGAAAMDLHACVDQAVTIPAGGRAVIPTGIAIALPSAGYVALVFARSGLASNTASPLPTAWASSTATTGERSWWDSRTPGTQTTSSSPLTASPS